MTERVVTFDDFSRGEFGDLGPRLPGQGTGFFTGKNVMRYRSGHVGPRPGLRAFPLSTGSFPTGEVRVLYASSSTAEETFAVIGDEGCQFSRSFSPLELTIEQSFPGGLGTIPASSGSPTNGQHRTDGNWVIVPGSGIYKFDIGLDDVVLVDGAITGRAFRFYKDRQLASESYEVWFSEPGIAGWDTFNDFFAGTSFNPVSGFFELRNGIVVAQSTPNLDMVTGTIGTSSSVLRRISTRTAPLDPYACASVGNEFLVIMGRNLRYPVLYNGAVWEELKHLAYAGTLGSRSSAANGTDQPAHGVYELESGGSWMILSGITGTGATNRMLLDWESCRTYHTWEVTVGPYMRRFETGVVLLTDGGAVGVAPEFYAWYPDLDRPAFTSDTYSQPGDTSDTPIDAYMHLPAWTAPDGKEVLVREVIVDFRKWDTGAAENNHFDVTVTSRSKYGTGAPVVSSTQEFDETGATATTAGVDARAHLYFGDQGYGGEFQIKVDAIAGCALRAFTVVLEERDAR